MTEEGRRYPLLGGHRQSPPLPTYHTRWPIIAFGGPVIGAIVFVTFLAWMQDVGFSDIVWSNVTFVFAVVWALGHVPAAIAATVWHFTNQRSRTARARLALALVIGGLSALGFGVAMLSFFFGFLGTPLQQMVLFGIGSISLVLTALPFAKARCEP